MATYAIGDIHGCYKTFRALLREVAFRPPKDRLWLVGDLVNRGPRSLDVLRWVADHEGSLTAVLGNHDLHLLGRAAGIAEPKARDTLDEILEAPDASQLLSWLRQRPLFYRHRRFAMVHAGLHPGWTFDEAQQWHRKVSRRLRGAHGDAFLAKLRSRPALGFDAATSPSQRRRAALFAFTLLRTCRKQGAPCMGFSGPPCRAPAGCKPWFQRPNPRDPAVALIFGHWAALGLWSQPGLVGLDSGCVWGGPLTALRLDDGALFQVANQDGQVANQDRILSR